MDQYGWKLEFPDNIDWKSRALNYKKKNTLLRFLLDTDIKSHKNEKERTDEQM
jgi:hypothetical protein